MSECEEDKEDKENHINFNELDYSLEIENNYFIIRCSGDLHTLNILKKSYENQGFTIITYFEYEKPELVAFKLSH